MKTTILVIGALCSGCALSHGVDGADDGGGAMDASPAVDGEVVAPDGRDADSGSPRIDGGETGAAHIVAMEISSHGGHTCAVDARRRLWCWGANHSAEILAAEEEIISEPVWIPLGHDTASVSLGPSTTLTLAADGTVWCWGHNGIERSCGNGTAVEIIREPTRVGRLRGVEHLFGGSCTVDVDGRTTCWGDGIPPTEIPLPGNLLQGSGVWGSGCARLEDDSLWCWRLQRAALGDPLDVEPWLLAEGVSSYWRGCGLMDGTLVCWSCIDPGCRPEPVIHDPPFVQLGRRVAPQGGCGIDGEGQLWCWGRNDHAQLGLGDTVDRAEPQRVELPGGVRSMGVSAAHTCALLEEGTVYCWGDGQFAGAGPGRELVMTPTRIRFEE